MRNPYPTKPGLGLRVAHATRILKRYGIGWSEEECGVNSRSMDNCFENYDGDAVVWALMDKAMRDEDIAPASGAPGQWSGRKGRKSIDAMTYLPSRWKVPREPSP